MKDRKPKDTNPIYSKWLALFSQTGSEICKVSDLIKRQPDKILTDNTGEVNPLIAANDNLCVEHYRSLKTKQEKLDYHRRHFDGYDIITLHGWLNIIPDEICDEYTIFNGHPGLVNLYPELAGKDPQIRTWENISKYQYVGSVLHEVTSVVDGGRIVCVTRTRADNCTSLDKTFDVLRGTSETCWLLFLREYLK